jgi:hypothetical protein
VWETDVGMAIAITGDIGGVETRKLHVQYSFKSELVSIEEQ